MYVMSSIKIHHFVLKALPSWAILDFSMILIRLFGASGLYILMYVHIIFQMAEVRLIEIYCDNLEIFCDTMQEVLGKLAFEVS